VTEPNEIVFMEPVEAEPVETQPVGAPGSGPSGSGGPRRPSTPVRIGIVAGTALLVVLGTVVAMGASPAPTAAPGSTAAPVATAAPGTTGTDNDGWHDAGMRDFGMRGGEGFRDITIASISGSNLSLKTDDGWTRTITPTSATTITKGGATITAADLAVGDQIVFSQAKQADGTYTITAIRVVLPTIGGQVTAISGNTLTVTQRDGTTATIHVDSSTTYQVQGVTSATLSDIKVGDVVMAQGTLRTDGSLDASTVASGFRGGPGWGGHGRGHGPDDWNNGQPAPTASPSATTTPG
jgi:Domain of unknown function (DUF5666)